MKEGIEGASRHTNKNESRVRIDSIEEFKRELTSIFNEAFVTLGHGTRTEAARSILANGLEMKSPELRTSTIGLGDNETDIDKILNWPHNQAKAIIIIMIPRDLPIVSQKQLLEPLENRDEQFGNQWRIPPQFIKGYIDVETKKFIPNELFQENPDIPVGRQEVPITPAIRIGTGDEHSGPVEIPRPTNASETDVF